MLNYCMYVKLDGSFHRFVIIFFNKMNDRSFKKMSTVINIFLKEQR
jgi:hypothetical protein